MKGHNMTNKCDSCGEETAYDQWSSYSNDNAENGALIVVKISITNGLQNVMQIIWII